MQIRSNVSYDVQSTLKKYNGTIGERVILKKYIKHLNNITPYDWSLRLNLNELNKDIARDKDITTAIFSRRIYYLTKPQLAPLRDNFVRFFEKTGMKKLAQSVIDCSKSDSNLTFGENITARRLAGEDLINGLKKSFKDRRFKESFTRIFAKFM